MPPLAAAAAPATFELVASQCPEGANKPRTGSAFVARGFPGVAGLALVTALHVVDGCQTIQVVRLACSSEGKTTRETMHTFAAPEGFDAWPTYDLAAFPAPRTIQGAAAANVGGSRPSATTMVRIGGSTQYDGCPDNIGFITDYADFKFLGQNLARRNNISLATAMGTLDPDARMVVYFGSTSEGASGGAVTRSNDDALLAVHLAGAKQFPLGFGILIDANMAAPKPALLGTHVPNYVRPFAAQSGACAAEMSDYGDASATFVRRHADGQGQFSLGGFAEFEPTTGGPSSLGPSLAYSAEIGGCCGDLLSHSWSVEGRVDYGFGAFSHPIQAPTGAEIEPYRASLRFLRAEANVAHLFNRLGSIRPSVSLGVRGSAMTHPAPGETDSVLDGSVGFPARVQVHFAFPWLHAIAIALTTSVDWAPTLRYRYSGLGAETVDAGHSWRVTLGIGLAYEIRFGGQP
jgi:hypothetical protein